MRKQIYSVLVIIFAATCLFLYSTLLSSSLRLERNKSLFNAHYYNKSADAVPLQLERPNFNATWLYHRFFQNPAEIELYLRAQLFYNEMDKLQHQSDSYQLLLASKPTWPYFYSGLAQIDLTNKEFHTYYIDKAIKYGAHERKVINSLAEVLFYSWDRIEKETRIKILDYLAKQTDSSIAQSVNISAKFSRIYEYCDFLYDKKQVEYASCKRHYWQPLTVL